LEWVNKQKELHDLYTAAERFRFAGDWEQAIENLEKVLEIDREYKDAAEKLQMVRDERELNTLYTKGMEYLKINEWHNAIECFEKAVLFAPTELDPETWLQSVETSEEAISGMPTWALASVRLVQAKKLQTRSIAPYEGKERIVIVAVVVALVSGLAILAVPSIAQVDVPRYVQVILGIALIGLGGLLAFRFFQRKRISMTNRKWSHLLLGLFAIIVGMFLIWDTALVRSIFQPPPTPVSVVPTYIPTPTYTPMPTSTDTPTPTPTGVPSPTNTPTPTPTATPTPTLSAVPSSAASPSIATPTATSATTGTPISTAISTPTQIPMPPTATPPHTSTPTPTRTPTVAVTIYLLETLTKEGFVTLSGEQVNMGEIYAGEIYEEGKFVYGNVAVQIGDEVYHSDEELASGKPKPLPDPWRVEFEFDELLVTRTGNRAGYNSKKAQFWVGTLDPHSAVGEDNPYSLTMKLYKGDELRKRIQVLFTVKDAPGSDGGGGPAATLYPTPPE
jgi:hypothetical protein